MSMLKCCFEPREIPEYFDTVIQKCSKPGCCCGCCSALRPRYKRLVDNIFPVNPEEGLVKSNMEKLTFYSLSSPEKLDRIGEYLYQKASKDISRKRYKLVEIAMEAMDLLLMACHAQTLNLFVESFLRMVQKLLEDTNPHLQILATNSFVRFANIEEDTPSYHRRYDFFISKFSSMCHGNHDNIELRDNIRMAGIRGLQGVIRKTVSDDLTENIWDKQHMEKIVPSLLFNMQSGTTSMSTEEVTPSTPPMLAEAVLRELVSRASFGHIKSVLRPLLTHLDRHELWVPNQFAIYTFRIVMISIQPQYSYTVVETLMQHLDRSAPSSPRIRTSLAVVLSKIIAIAAGESVGPSALDIINNLLTHLRTSVTSQKESTPEEVQYQEALINALGEFANHHPDYQKIEIMLFIMNTVPDLTKKSKSDQMLQNILLKSLLKVGMQYRTVSFEKAFPASFLQPLLKMARSPHIPTRIIVMNIFQALLDRHQNQSVLSTVTVKNYPTLSLESPSRPDIIFSHKHGPNILQALLDAMSLDDDIEAIISVYNTAALFICEMACSDIIQELLLFILGIQLIATNKQELSYAHKCNLHAIAIALLALMGRCTGVSCIIDYTGKVIELRREEADYLLPPLIDPESKYERGNLTVPHLMIDKVALVECLQTTEMEYNLLQNNSPYNLDQAEKEPHRRSWVDAAHSLPQRGSGNDLQSYDVDSATSSPGLQKRILPNDLNFDAMKRALAEPNDTIKFELREKDRQINKIFREAKFEDLMRRTEPKHELIQNRLNELFNTLAIERQINHSEANKAQSQHQIQIQQQPYSPGNTNSDQIPIYEKQFPELFFH